MRIMWRIGGDVILGGGSGKGLGGDDSSDKMWIQLIGATRRLVQHMVVPPRLCFSIKVPFRKQCIHFELFSTESVQIGGLTEYLSDAST